MALERLALAPHPGSSPVPLPRLLDDSGTTAFVVVSDGRIVWERFGHGGRADQPARCFSVTKSVASALVGLAVGSGAIASVETPIGAWLPEPLDPRVRDLSLVHLLEMRSGIGFVEGVVPWCDEPRTYYATDLRRRLLTRTLMDAPGAFFHYNDWHPLLLTLLLECATGMPVTAWLQEKLWNPLGAESRGSMMVDRSGADGVEHLESGLTASAYDLAKFGQLYLQDGVWMGKHILPDGWVSYTRAPAPAARRSTYGAHFWLATPAEYRGPAVALPADVFQAVGHEAQFITIVPSRDVVIVRLGRTRYPGVWAQDRFVAAVLAALGS